MNKKVDLVQQVVATIEEWIISGKYKNMDLLPSEGDISTQLEVSRATARDAIRVLEVRGYLERIHGIGVKVNNRSSQVAIKSLSSMIQRDGISYEELLSVRRMIEPEAAYLAAQFAQQAERDILRECVEVMEVEEITSEIHQENDYIFHETLAKASGNRLLHTIVCSYSALLLQQINDADTAAIAIETTHHFHRKIYECIINNDADGAKEHMLIHLHDTEKNLMQLNVV
ncbi:MAG: FadR family transcriptional regulator [Vallitaleaceae bacterium]|nr:FadR family transcriptional regulator [Vallitaleaceae bacterium]